jgi:hypothetical protein
MELLMNFVDPYIGFAQPGFADVSSSNRFANKSPPPCGHSRLSTVSIES